MEVESKAKYIVRAKALLRADLRARSWPEKVRTALLMYAAQQSAQQAMRLTLRGTLNQHK